MSRKSIASSFPRIVRWSSLGIALLLVALWIGTSFRGWSCQWANGGGARDFGDYLGVRGSGGGIEFTRWRAVPSDSVPDEWIIRYRWIGERPVRAHFTTYRPDAGGVLAASPFVGDDPLGFARELSQQRVNFHDYANDADIPYTVNMSVVRVRYWLLTAIALLPAMPWLVSRFSARQRRHRRLAAGLCVNCGYDLRAGHARCPECGHATSPSTPAWSA